MSYVVFIQHHCRVYTDFRFRTADHGAFVGLTTETANALTDEEVKTLEIGSKALFVAWLSYVTLIWSLKASVLCFYSRLTYVPSAEQPIYSEGFGSC